jgi:hypothetical protein
MSLIISFFCRVAHFWSYANTIETAVLLVILYDIIWHRLNALREIKREEEAEVRKIQREEDAEKRHIRREWQESIRKHWQELQSNLILLHRVASQLTQQRQFIKANNNAQDATTKRLLEIMTTRLPEVLSEFNDRWGRVVAQLNVFPEPRELLALEVLEKVEELGQTTMNSQSEVKDETLAALANLSRRVADVARFPNLDCPTNSGSPSSPTEG